MLKISAVRQGDNIVTVHSRFKPRQIEQGFNTAHLPCIQV